MRRVRHTLIAASLAILVSNGQGAAAPEKPQRRYEVRDSIELASFTEPGIFSPDGRWFVTVTQRGLLPEGVTEATIRLFDTAAIQRAIRAGRAPVAVDHIELARFAAAINGGHSAGFGRIIMNVRWSADGGSLLFLGRDGRENRQLFRVGLQNRKSAALTPAKQDVVDYASDGDQIAYLAGPDVIEEKLWSSTDPAAPDIVAGTGQSIDELLYPNSRLNHRFMPMEFEIWRIRAAQPEPVLDADTGKPMRVVGSYYAGAMALSTATARLILIAHADRIPPDWEKYDSPGGLDGQPFAADSAPMNTPVPLIRRLNDYTRARQYEVIDLAKGTRDHLIAAPVMDFLRGGEDEFHAAWSPDGRSIVLSQTFLPPDQTTRGASTRPCAVAVVGAGGAVACLMELRRWDEPRITGLGWEQSGKRIIVQFADASAVAYELRGESWSTMGRQRNPFPMDLTVRQALNDPPALYANRAGKERKIYDPNPQLKDIALGEVINYFWKGPRGQDGWGGLVKPPDFSPSRRYPLVIQTHGHAPDDFFSVGYSNTTNAGRALAARGMLVLQVSEPHAKSDGTWEESQERATEVYLAAVDQLAREGLVDPTKVGVGGYSRRGLYVVKALEDAPDRFAAAVVGDSVPGSLFDYYMMVDFRDPKLTGAIAKLNAGARPYGAGLQKWLDRSGGLRTDRIQAPVLVSAAFPTSLMVLWNLYAPLRDQGKPVELQYIRTGSHTFTKPLQVLAHQEMLVDWYDFWLNGHEDDDPAKADQYARWRQMKKPPR
jgi:dipeptidyl aminopeptidase/acylaminoacyl peptidase